MSAKKLQELGTNPFPYIVPFIPRLLPKELIKGEHFILTNLLKSILGSSSQARFDQEPQVEFAQEALTTFVRPDQSPLSVHDPKPVPPDGEEEEEKEGDEGWIGKACRYGVGRLRGLGKSSYPRDSW